MITTYPGILASIDWNSHLWRDLPSDEDIRRANYGYVKVNEVTFTCLNFANDIYVPDKDGYYFGLLPQMWSRTPDKTKARHLIVVFQKSHNYNDGINYIVGLYAFPLFEHKVIPSPIPEKMPGTFEVNVKSLPSDIHLLQNFIPLNSEEKLRKFLPKGKQLGKQGFNYLEKANVLSILDACTAMNPSDVKLSRIKYRILKEIGN